MKTNNRFIVVEGIMGSGKTTLAKMLARELKGVYYNTPESFRQMRPLADSGFSIEARYYFYLSLNIQTSLEVGELLKTQSVVCDKYIWSTFCYHKTLGLENLDFPKPQIIIPDFCFLIFCEDGVRLTRISSRDPVNDYSKDIKRQNMERRCLKEFKRVLPNNIIDNTLSDPQIAFSKILKKIN